MIPGCTSPSLTTPPRPAPGPARRRLQPHHRPAGPGRGASAGEPRAPRGRPGHRGGARVGAERERRLGGSQAGRSARGGGGEG